MARIASVLLPMPLPEAFDYAEPEGMDLALGDIVAAPLGPRMLRGVVTGLREAAGGLEVFEEPELLGSAGGLRHALGRTEGPLAVWNADAVASVPWDRLRAAHRGLSRELDWLLVPHPGGPWTQVWLDAEDRVLPRGVAGRGPFHFTGASLWSEGALACIPEGPSELAPLLPGLDHLVQPSRIGSPSE